MSQRFRHPLQPIVTDERGIIRFQANAIVLHLLDSHPTVDMNALACMEFTRNDREQFAQLIGYSVSGFSELYYVRDKTWAKVEEKVKKKEQA